MSGNSTPVVLDLSVEDILTDRDNNRDDGPDEDLQALGQSIEKIGQQQPVVVYRDESKYRLIAGHRRLKAAKLVGLRTLKALLMSKPVGGRLVLGQMAENKARRNLTPPEDLRAVQRANAENPGMTNREIAAHTGYSEAEVSKWLTVASCPRACAGLADGTLQGLTDAYAVAKAPADAKDGLIALRRAGQNSHVIAAAARKRRTNNLSVKQSRTLIPLPTGAKVLVTGVDLDLDGLIEALHFAIDAARRANKDRLDIKTFAKVAADKAKA